MNRTDKIDKNKFTKKKSMAEKAKPAYIANLVDEDHLIEMCYDSDKEETYFFVWDGEEYKKELSYTKNGLVYEPFPRTKDIIKKGAVLFPSEPLDYGSTQDLMHDVHTFINKYVTISEKFEKVAAQYVLFSYLSDRFEEVPYLRALGDYGQGKSRLLRTIGTICNRPTSTGGNATVSSVFRLLNDYRGTLILDEADIRVSDTQNEFVKVLNSGFQKNIPVTRAVGTNNKNFDIESFNIFGCKIIGARYHYDDDALESRILTEEMSLIKNRDDVPISTGEDFHSEAQQLRNKLLLYRFQNYKKTRYRNELKILNIEPRLNQIAVPLLSIVDDPETLHVITEYFLECNQEIKANREHSLEYMLAEAVCHFEYKEVSVPTISTITERFNNNIDDHKAPRSVGYHLRKKFGLRIEHTRNGNIIAQNEKNKMIIKSLAEKYDLDVNV